MKIGGQLDAFPGATAGVARFIVVSHGQQLGGNTITPNNLVLNKKKKMMMKNDTASKSGPAGQEQKTFRVGQ